MLQTILKIVAACIVVSVITHFGIIYFTEFEMSIHGHIAMGIGILFTYGVGAGLMALLFFSNKHGHDDEVYTSSQAKENSDDQ